MKIVLLFCLVFIATASAYSIFQDEWDTWKDLHGKQYSYDEEIKRKYIWQTNLKRVIRHNQEAENGEHTYTLGMNQFADLDADEFAYNYLGTQTRSGEGYCSKMFFGSDEAQAANKTVDWRNEGYVTPTGSLEGQHFKATGKLVSLSEQNLMDCSRPEGDMSCQGGIMDNAFEYIIKNDGIDTEASYPYKANNSQTCDYNPMNKGATVKSCVDIERGDEKALRKAVAKIGPISVAIDASKPTFHLYKEGVYYEPTCSSTRLDHGVLAVGYGHEKKGGAYWLVKNSWGEMWGQKGYIKMARNHDNNCGIATQASYPVV